MDYLFNSVYISSEVNAAIADDIHLTAKESLFGLKDFAERTWIELLYYILLYYALFYNGQRSAANLLTDQEVLDIKEEIQQVYIP